MPVLLSVKGGMVHLIGFFTLGNIFTAHITGNVVLGTAATMHGGPVNPGGELYLSAFDDAGRCRPRRFRPSRSPFELKLVALVDFGTES
jgi:hypothetical protein